MIKRRKVFYISGFDPRGARYYHQLYKREAQKGTQGLEISARKKISKIETGWEIKNAKTKTDYSFLCWDDIIRENWITNPKELLLKSANTYLNYIKNFDWKVFLSFNKMSLITIIHPILFFDMYLILFSLFFILNPALVISIIFITTILTKRRLKHIESAWLQRVFIYFSKLFRAKNNKFFNRTDKFAKIIYNSIKKDKYDEILIISHSIGSIVNAFVLENLIKRLDNKNWPKKVKIITLGQFIPLVTPDKKAKKFKKAMNIIAVQENLTWLDLSNPGDRACFPLTNPFKHITDKINANVVIANPEFNKLYSLKEYIKLSLNKFDFHFLYLKKSEFEGAYDYFKMTASTKPFDEFIKELKVI